MPELSLSQTDWIIPQWPVPCNIKALSTTRNHGCSKAPFNTLNLGDRSGDDIEAVLANRDFLRRIAALPAEPIWLMQTHSADVVQVHAESSSPIHADAAYTLDKNRICTVQTADCLPVLLCDIHGRAVAAIHAGWRGLAGNIIGNTIELFSRLHGIKRQDILAWMGPAIGPQAFEVGWDVLDVFVRQDARMQEGFIQIKEQKWLVNIFRLAVLQMNWLGVTQVFGGGICTYNDAGRFYSYRRDKTTGRMATLIWISE